MPAPKLRSYKVMIPVTLVDPDGRLSAESLTVPVKAEEAHEAVQAVQDALGWASRAHGRLLARRAAKKVAG